MTVKDMAPKKTKSSAQSAAKASTQHNKAAVQPDNSDNKTNNNDSSENLKASGRQSASAKTGTTSQSDESKANKKRKAPASKDERTIEPESKAARRSGRGAKSAPSPGKILQYLLDSSSAEFCQSTEEAEAFKDGKDSSIRLYTIGTPLSVFEELMAAVILSRPISHRLGHRSIRTVLNAPYSFSSARAVIDQGEDKCIQALYDAHTQHKDKTAAEIFGLAKTVLDEFDDPEDKDGTSLIGIRKAADNDADKERALIREKVKGVGKTGLDIFFRRVQWLWDEVFPFIDGKTQDALRELGLGARPDDLVKAIDDDWNDLKTFAKVGEDDEEKKRRLFVVILERVLGASLERNIDAVKEAVASSQ